MTIAPAKGVSVLSSSVSTPAAGKAAPSPSDASTATTDSTASVLNQFFQTQQSDKPSVDPNTNPLAALRAMLEDQSTAVPDHPVPTVEEILAETMTTDPAGVTWIDGTIEDQYAQLKFEYQTAKAELKEQRTTGGFTPSQLVTVQQTIAELDQKILAIDAQVDRVRTVAGQFQDTYAKEMDLMRQFGRGEIDAVDCDLNKDGIIGNPITSEYALASRVIDGTTESTIVLKETGRPARFDRSGNALEGNVLNPKYTWNLNTADTGLKNNGINATGELVMQVNDPNTKITKESYEGSGNDFTTQIVVPMPDALWVETFSDGTPKTQTDDDGNICMKILGDGTVKPDDSDIKSGKYRQIKITDVELSSDRENPPTNWKDGDSWDADTHGADQIVEFKHGDTVVLRMRITGPETAGEQADNNVDGFVAASSCTLALWGGAGKDSRRTDGVNIEVGDDYLSTSYARNSTAAFAAGSSEGGWREDATYQNTGHAPYDGKPIAHRTGEYFSGEPTAVEGKTLDIRNGVMFMGVRGHLTGTQYNDAFDVLPPDVDKSSNIDQPGRESPLYRTVIDAKGGLNAVFAKHGDHFIKGATFVDIDAHGGDNNYVQLNNLLHVKDNTGSGAAKDWTLNPALQVRINGGNHAYVDNLTDDRGNDLTIVDPTDNKLPDAYEGSGIPQEEMNLHENDAYGNRRIINGLGWEQAVLDDEYDIHADTVNARDTNDSDLANDLGSLATEETDTIDELFSTNGTEVFDAIRNEYAIQDTGALAEQEAWKLNAGEYYTNAVTSMDGFFSAYRRQNGLAPEGSGASDDEVGKLLDEQFGTQPANVAAATGNGGAATK